ncbi:MAG: manganese efflux pump MntP family protein [Methanomicrobiales archaeon]|nr:manganese efflux pump MntP family protein [Methanomicrobiales archaeon]MDD1660093.1 manganese efflux pump MntP family protein [Methanomicrobiales archaeon]
MDLPSLLLIAVGLAMDCFAVALVAGVAQGKSRIRNAIRIALAFGSFQSGMLILGWWAGTLVLGIIAPFDHWVAFGLLALIGVKMVRESREEEEAPSDLTLGTLLLLSVATSIDSLAVGISLAVLSPEVLVPAVIIGAVTFGIALAGALLGGRIREAYGRMMVMAGGLLLIGIGVRILLEHYGWI